MGKYLVLWEVDSTRVPVDAKERGAAWLAMADMVEEEMRKGMLKDWGIFPGELNGYSVEEGTELEVMNNAMQYAPYIKFKVHPVASLEQAREAIKASMK
jgi:hypothetical protein